MYEEDPSKCGRVLFGDMSNSQQVMMMVTLLSRMMMVTTPRRMMVTISIIEDHKYFCRRDSSILPYGPTARMLRDSDPERACAIKCYSTDSKEVKWCWSLYHSVPRSQGAGPSLMALSAT